MEVEENGTQFIRLEPAKILRLEEENSKLKSTDVNSNYNKNITDKNIPVNLNPPPVVTTVSKEIPSIWAGLGEEKTEGIYIYVCTFIFMCLCICIYLCMSMCICMYAYICIYIHL
jgi:hypothetical protein